MEKSDKKSCFFGKCAINSTNCKKVIKNQVFWKKWPKFAKIEKNEIFEGKMEKVLFIGHFGKKREK